MREINIGNKIVGKGSPVYIIAEVGSNHDGSFEKAKNLIKVASKCGADAVKFQLFKAEKIAANIDNEITRLPDGKTLYQLYKENETPYEWCYELNAYCKENDINFLATPFDKEAVDILDDVRVNAYKIASFEIVDFPLIEYISKKRKPIIISTGMANIEDIDDAVQIIKEYHSQYVLLHCGINYPLNLSDVNLLAIKTLQDRYNCPIGYSDHTEGRIVPILGVGLGMSVIERHITLDKGSSGPDHKFATNPEDFKNIVNSIRMAEMALGSPKKRKLKSEEIHYVRGRRSIFAVKDLKKGTILKKDHLAILRPALGLHPRYLDEVIGKKILSNISKYTPIKWDLLEK